jgi:hypothetical protein
LFQEFKQRRQHVERETAPASRGRNNRVGWAEGEMGCFEQPGDTLDIDVMGGLGEVANRVTDLAELGQMNLTRCLWWDVHVMVDEPCCGVARVEQVIVIGPIDSGTRIPMPRRPVASVDHREQGAYGKTWSQGNWSGRTRRAVTVAATPLYRLAGCFEG